MGSLSEDSTPPSQRRRSGYGCNVAHVLNDLDNDDRTVLLSWLNNRRQYGARQVSERLAEHDITLSLKSIQRHRRRECCCVADHPEWFTDG